MIKFVHIYSVDSFGNSPSETYGTDDFDSLYEISF